MIKKKKVKNATFSSDDEEEITQVDLDREVERVLARTERIGNSISQVVQNDVSHVGLKHSDIAKITPPGVALKEYQLVGVNWLWLLHREVILFRLLHSVCFSLLRISHN